MRRLFVLVGTLTLLLLSGHALGACTALLGDFTVLAETADGGEAGPAGKVNGATCAAGGECSSGNCADGVCCDMACSGTCESCNMPGMPGVCVPIPDGQDPEKECKTTPLPMAADDAGSTIGDAGADGGDDAGEGGTTFQLPDAGLTSDDNMCAGTCNGKRACGFAGTERTCGTVFCGNATEQGRASCDGKGHCLYGVEECSAYACPNGAPGCKMSCASEADCLSTHFCDVASSTCKPKVANGTACASVTQCQSGNCPTADHVCCNSPCDPADTAGATCSKMGFVGKCICSACTTGPCQLYYQDLDGDGYGNANGKVSDGTAAFGCAAGPPPAGFVANKADCYDAVGAIAASVHPNQAAGVYYASSYTVPGGSPSFDYDCDSIENKETREYPGSTGCRYCVKAAAPLIGCTFNSSCSTTSQVAGLGCASSLFIGQCSSDSAPGYVTTVACGDTGTKYYCGACGSVPGAPSQSTSAGFKQRCR